MNISFVEQKETKPTEFCKPILFWWCGPKVDCVETKVVTNKKIDKLSTDSPFSPLLLFKNLLGKRLQTTLNPWILISHLLIHLSASICALESFVPGLQPGNAESRGA